MADKLPALQWDTSKFNFQRKLGNFVQFFQINLPTNSYGVPMKIIDPTIIASNLLDCESTDDISDEVVDAATLNVDFEEGVPLVEGLPIWERFDGELLDYYKLFKEYREMLYVSGTRAITKLANSSTIEGKILNTLSKAYHWQLRCKAYDAYRAMEREKKRLFEMSKLESKHSEAAASLLERSLAYIEDHPEQLNPKVALQMFQIAVKTGRLALGLSPDKPGAGDGGPQIHIQQHTNVASDGSSINQITPEKSERDTIDADYAQSIMHILDQTGALDKAKKEIIVEGDFSEVTEDDGSNAVEGA